MMILTHKLIRFCFFSLRNRRLSEYIFNYGQPKLLRILHTYCVKRMIDRETDRKSYRHEKCTEENERKLWQNKSNKKRTFSKNGIGWEHFVVI